MRTLLLFALAGACGSLSRYGLSSLIGQLLRTTFPAGIFITNVLGCFLFGLVFGLATLFNAFSDETRVILLTGFMGAFTTFSTFIFDCHALLESGRWCALALNLGGQVLLGIAALRVGIWVAGLIH